MRAEQVGCSVPAPRSWQERVHAERRGHRAGLAVVRREREGGSALRVWSHAPEDGRGFAAFRLSLGADAPGWTLYGEQSALPLEDWMLRIGGISSAFLLGALTAFVCSTVVTATSPLQSCDKEFYNLEQQWQTRL